MLAVLGIRLAAERRENAAQGASPGIARALEGVPQGRQKRESTALSRWFSLLSVILMSGSSLASDCIPFTDAQNHIGDHRCVSGKVLRIEQGGNGATFLDFCDDYRVCPFTVVVFRGDLKDVGDVRQLAGRTIEISGDIKAYDGRAEIILREARQLKGEAAKLPALPKSYDVEKKGRYSAGQFSHPKTARKPARKKQTAPIPTIDPADPSGAPE